MNIIGRRRIWYSISLAVILPGLISLVVFHLKLGIDFKGGSLLEIQGGGNASAITAQAKTLGFQDVTVTSGSGEHLLIRYRDPGSPDQAEARHKEFKAALATTGLSEISYSTIGSSVSRDITRNALLAIAAASFAIVCYVAFAFRNAPPPVSPWSFGVTAIIALLHDAFFVLGVFSLLGHFFGIEVDALFVTAVLTVIGFSVHDTIVVFDRIRENLRRERASFETVVNDSILETFARSINTSLTVLLTLLALFLFGGESIRYFVLALLVGVASGTYSSIFNASPLLVSWHNYKLKRAKARP
ncbi:MAG TPA: protein translocase subunit SecF [Candidatus Saccharimonadales bacterium]|nr:protein translocase subunit SecF [Candidatus Saccharimonadales bacterium]